MSKLAYHSTIPDHIHLPASSDPNDPRREDQSITKWSGDTDTVPAIGANVHVTINKIGRAKVLRYFTESGWLGLLVEPYQAPAWYRKQNGHKPCHVFGIEIRTTLQFLNEETAASFARGLCLSCAREENAAAGFPGIDRVQDGHTCGKVSP